MLGLESFEISRSVVLLILILIHDVFLNPTLCRHFVIPLILMYYSIYSSYSCLINDCAPYHHLRAYMDST